MIKFEKTQVVGWEPSLRGMRNPKNSWDRSDSIYIDKQSCDRYTDFVLAQLCGGTAPIINKNDLKLANQLSDGGPVHAKYRRMIVVYVDIIAPLYWWKEFDTYKVGTVSNSSSTMHKIADKEFTLDNFSHEHLLLGTRNNDETGVLILNGTDSIRVDGDNLLSLTINVLNYYRKMYLETKNKKYWWQMIQLLPSSYNQRRTIMMNYEVLSNIYEWRRHHKLDEWCDFCNWIEDLPYSELITHAFQKEDIRSNSNEDQETINVYGQRIPKKDIQNSDSYSDVKFNGGL